ncbi:MAG: glycosyltransferase [Acetobacter sp.]|nr:glycosyltransferase [Bacteroides sp.]MCM1341566.1 glycosyltransferase [Acetobacter sp.]MCM1433643.1 glycosyltransferase [Clostridiales bacterium]
MQKKKVLIINECLEYGGSEFVAIRLQQALDSNKFECVYCVRGDKKGPIEDNIASTGVRIIHQPDSKLGYAESYKFYIELFKNEHFDIVHSHLLFYSAIVLLAAYKSGVPKRIAHSHFTQPLAEHSKLKQIAAKLYRNVMKFLLKKYATDIIGCSKKSGEYLTDKKYFNKKGIVLNNGIDTDEYSFDLQARNRIREELGVGDKIVLGHIGHMYYIKNQDFLIDVFNEYHVKNKNSVLLLVGDGEDREKLEKKCRDLNLNDSVIFAGFRDDVPDLLNAMDCFVFPSLHEGFPLTLIEAQASKLPCVVSANISKGVKINSNVYFESIDENPAKWIDSIEKSLVQKRNSVDNSDVIKNFDIRNITRKLEGIYLR